MILTIQPPALMMPQEKNSIFIEEYYSRPSADARAKEINGVVIKEWDKEIYRIFKTAPTQTVGYITEE